MIYLPVAFPAKLKHIRYVNLRCVFNHSRPDPGRRKKLAWIFIFTLYGAAKGFMEAFNAFIKSFEAPESSVNIKM